MKRYMIGSIFAVVAIITILVFVLMPQKKYPNDPNTYLGTWVAVEHIPANNIEMSDFFPEKYLGNHIVLSPNEYYFENFLEYFAPIKVYGYSIKKIDKYDFWIGYKTWLFELGIDEEFATVLCARKEFDPEAIIGIIVSTEELICGTGSGWYRYLKQ